MSKSRIFILAVLLLAGGGIAWLAGVHERVRAAAIAAPDAVPVSAAPAKVQDVPESLDGLGTVQALNTVEVKAQVSGMLIALPVRQGQEAKKGDILAEIDPRPYQAVLDQAKAKLAGDQATLNNDASSTSARFRAGQPRLRLTSASGQRQGRPADRAGHHRGRPGGDRGGPAQPGILHHPGAVRWPRRLLPD